MNQNDDLDVIVQHAMSKTFDQQLRDRELKEAAKRRATSTDSPTSSQALGAIVDKEPASRPLKRLPAAEEPTQYRAPSSLSSNSPSQQQPSFQSQSLRQRPPSSRDQASSSSQEGNRNDFSTNLDREAERPRITQPRPDFSVLGYVYCPVPFADRSTTSLARSPPTEEEDEGRRPSVVKQEEVEPPVRTSVPASTPIINVSMPRGSEWGDIVRRGRTERGFGPAYAWGTHQEVHPYQTGTHLMPGGPDSHCESECPGRLSRWMMDDFVRGRGPLWAHNVDAEGAMSIRMATRVETYMIAKYCAKMRERMNAVACNEEIWRRRVDEYQRRLRQIAGSLFPTLVELPPDPASSINSEQDNSSNMPHAEKENVRSNEPGKPANDKDCAEAS